MKGAAQRARRPIDQAHSIGLIVGHLGSQPLIFLQQGQDLLGIHLVGIKGLAPRLSLQQLAAKALPAPLLGSQFPLQPLHLPQPRAHRLILGQLLTVGSHFLLQLLASASLKEGSHALLPPAQLPLQCRHGTDRLRLLLAQTSFLLAQLLK